MRGKWAEVFSTPTDQQGLPASFLHTYGQALVRRPEYGLGPQAVGDIMAAHRAAPGPDGWHPAELRHAPPAA
eukprot:15100273-Alexandrium_andersonii.AAC.1